MSVIDAYVGRRECFLLLDTCFRHICLRWDDGTENLLRLLELMEPRRGQDVSPLCAWARDVEKCVLLGTAGDTQSFLCCFPLKAEADDFYSCITILRLSVRFALQAQESPDSPKSHDPLHCDLAVPHQ